MYNIETRATKEELSVERSRIDSFTRLEEGSTTGDAELQDIRVMVDGTISDTAGNAVRTQINELKGDLSNLSSEIDDLNRNLEEYGNVNIMDFNASFNSDNYQNVAFTWNNKKCEVNGANNSSSLVAFNNIYVNTTSLPKFMKTDDYYIVDYESTDDNIYVEIFIYYPSGGSTHHPIRGKTKLHIPSNAVGMIVRVAVTPNATVNGTIEHIYIGNTYDFIEDDKIIAPNTDLDGVKESGIYLIGSDRNILNTPFAPSDASWLEVYSYRDIIIQKITSFEKGYTFSRSFINFWRKWGKPLTTKNYKIAMFGDSITWGAVGTTGIQATKTFADVIAEDLNVTVSNFGVSSMGYFTDHYATSALDYIKTIDLSVYDCVTLAFGANDGMHPLGTYDTNDLTTFIGRQLETINYLRTTYPNILVIVIGQQLLANRGEFPRYAWDMKYLDSSFSSETMDVEQLKFADYYLTPYISMKHSAINGFNANIYLSDGGVHPTQEGYIAQGHYLSGQISKYIG